VLHRVTAAEQGPVDSVLTGPDGTFRFPLGRDTSALHLLSARHHGIEYFSTPLKQAPSGTEAVTLVVHDTSSRAPVGLASRHVVVPRAGEGGVREILDLVLLNNTGTMTRVAPDSLSASWTGPLPPGSEGLEVGESDVSPDAVLRQGDTVVVSAPIAPGEKQLALQYHLPAGRRELAIPLGPEPLAFTVLLEDPGATVSAPGLALADSQVLEGRSFRRWTGDLAANTVVRVSLPGTDPNATAILAVLVTTLVLTLAAAAWWALPRVKPVSVDRLIGEIAMLDARYEGRQADTAPEEWTRYVERRGKLKAELTAALGREVGSR
jgi:hypothetical protein